MPFFQAAYKSLIAGALALCLLPVTVAQTLIRDAEIEATLREYTDPILEAAGLVPEDVGLYIISDDSLNAFVANGQRIHLFTGLIMESETPSQLKGVIAHETGHISGAHAARRARDMEIAARPAYIAIGLGLLAIAAGEPGAGATLIGGSGQVAAMNLFVHTRIQESSADQSAVTFLEDVGVSPRGLIEFFEKFRYQEVLSEARRYEYFRTHPLSSDRIQALRQRASETGLMDAPDSERAIQQLDRMHAKLIGFTRTPGHVLRRYPPDDTSTEAIYARAISAYKVNDVQSAIDLVDELIGREPENPYFHELKGQILLESGQPDASIPWIENAIELSGGHPLMQIMLAQSLVARANEGDYAEAETLLRAALRTEPENGFAYRELAIALDRQGRTAEAKLATAEQAYMIGDLPRANWFAGLALKDLDRNTPLWVRANDIMTVTDPRLPENRRAYQQRRFNAQNGFAVRPQLPRN